MNLLLSATIALVLPGTGPTVEWSSFWDKKDSLANNQNELRKLEAEQTQRIHDFVVHHVKRLGKGPWLIVGMLAQEQNTDVDTSTIPTGAGTVRVTTTTTSRAARLKHVKANGPAEAASMIYVYMKDRPGSNQRKDFKLIRTCPTEKAADAAIASLKRAASDNGFR